MRTRQKTAKQVPQDLYPPLFYNPYKTTPTKHIYVRDGQVYFVFNSQAGPYQVAQGAVRRYNPATKEWTDLTSDDTGHGWGDLEIDPDDPNTLYLSTMGKWGAQENDCIYRSTDGGASREGLFTGDGQDRIFELDYSGAKWLGWGGDHAKLGWMIGDLEVNPFNRDELIYGTGATVFHSTNLTEWGKQPVHFEVYCAGIEKTATSSARSGTASPPITESSDRFISEQTDAGSLWGD